MQELRKFSFPSREVVSPVLLQGGVLAANGVRAGEMASWGHAVHGSRFGSMPWQLGIREAFQPPLPNVSKADVKLP